jgi:mutator protein MutT
MTAPAQLIAIAVVEQAGHFLIGQRSAGVPLAGLWEFPGGKVQPGEEAPAAAVRECLEETGLPVEVCDEYLPHEQAYAHGVVWLRFFACRPLDSSLTPLAPFRWVSREELAKYDFPKGNRALLAHLTSPRT